MKLLRETLTVLLGLMLAQAAGAVELRVLSAGAVEPGLKAAAAAYQRETGVQVHVDFATSPQLRKRVASGEAADVLIAPPAVIEEFARDQKVAQLRAGLGRVGLGVAVRPDAPVPDISSAAALQRSVMEADSLTFNTASTGLYFEGLLKKMGIYESVQAKTTRYPDGASVMEHLLRGKGREVGFGPITEILQFRDKGLRLVGPLPPEVQNYTGYTAAPHSASANTDAAAAFVRYLASPAGKAYFTAAGIE
jgi:molybdate transport system substrate-binding protein